MVTKGHYFCKEWIGLHSHQLTNTWRYLYLSQGWRSLDNDKDKHEIYPIRLIHTNPHTVKQSDELRFYLILIFVTFELLKNACLRDKEIWTRDVDKNQDNRQHCYSYSTQRQRPVYSYDTHCYTKTGTSL